MLIAVGCDHAGFLIKNEVIHFVESLGYQVKDFGTNSGDSVDYPDFAHRVAEAVAAGVAERGIVICGTGIGVSIAANKVKGIRAALCTSIEHARLSRAHNDANVLALGARMTNIALIREIIKVWLMTKFEGGRHQIRVGKIEI